MATYAVRFCPAMSLRCPQMDEPELRAALLSTFGRFGHVRRVFVCRK